VDSIVIPLVATGTPALPPTHRYTQPAGVCAGTPYNSAYPADGDLAARRSDSWSVDLLLLCQRFSVNHFESEAMSDLTVRCQG
jgi:hypothetical protein